MPDRMKTSGWTHEAHRAANFLCGMPAYGNTTLERDDFRSLMLNSGGTLLAGGRLWNIVSKHLGAGVYKVSLELANP
jgi:hypothetical protein